MKLKRIWRVDEVNGFVHAMEGCLPEDTIMIGMGAGILAKQLNRSNSAVIYPEFSSHDTLESDRVEETGKLNEQLHKGKYMHIFASDAVKDYIPEEYKAIGEYEYGCGGPYCLYELQE